LTIRDHTIEANSIHKLIPDGFFSQSRWGLDDELKSQAILRHEMALLDKKIALVELQIKAHLDEAIIWKDRIKELTRHSEEYHKPTLP